MDLARVKTTPLASRSHLVSVDDFAGVPGAGASFAEVLDSLPRVLAANVLRDLADAVAGARAASREVVVALGGHVIKTGCGPILIDLARRGLVTAFVMNGAAAIHDVEIAIAGRTSENVPAGLDEGTYGTTEETGAILAAAAKAGRETGLGPALTADLVERDPSHADASVLVAAARHDIPVTVHVAIGNDTVHTHPAFDGGDVGAATGVDFRRVCTLVARCDGAVWMNVGSAVVLPEVLLKAVAVARNLGRPVADLTTANLDMLRHYRTGVNVLGRFATRGLEITGHHEITLPLLRMAILARAQGSGRSS
jgi:deoxyhypusine synthase